MTFLPIVARELRVASRRAGTYWLRSAGALALIVTGVCLFLILAAEPTHSLGRVLFWFSSGGVVLYCLLGGVWSTADCLSEEKREGTLGLLFLTDLKGYDVVFGKLAATSVNGLYAVLAAVPILALPLLMGGVDPGEVWRMGLVAVNTLFFSLAVGMCVSAVSRSALKAIVATLALILTFTAVLPAWGAWLAMLGRVSTLGTHWFLASVGYSYYWALDTNYLLHPERFWLSVAVMHGLGWSFLLLACVITPRAWQVRPANVRALRLRESWRAWSYGDDRERKDYRARLLDRGAYFWLAARSRLKPACVWGMLGVVACGWVWGLARSRQDWLEEGIYVMTGLLLNLLIKVWFGLEAGRQLGEDRRDGALELLLSTPLTVRDILRGQLLALRRQFQWPTLVVLMVFTLFLVVGLHDTASMEDPEARVWWAMFWAGAIVMMLADLAALYWLGMWQGLVAKNPLRAAANSLACILVLPWAIVAWMAFMTAILWPNLEGQPVLQIFFAAWLLAGLAVDAGFAILARHRLLTNFRLAATRRYERAPGFWAPLVKILPLPRRKGEGRGEQESPPRLKTP